MVLLLALSVVIFVKILPVFSFVVHERRIAINMLVSAFFDDHRSLDVFELWVKSGTP